jgi:hypothetical protein
MSFWADWGGLIFAAADTAQQSGGPSEGALAWLDGYAMATLVSCSTINAAAHHDSDNELLRYGFKMDNASSSDPTGW